MGIKKISKKAYTYNIMTLHIVILWLGSLTVYEDGSFLERVVVIWLWFGWSVGTNVPNWASRQKHLSLLGVSGSCKGTSIEDFLCRQKLHFEFFVAYCYWEGVCSFVSDFEMSLGECVGFCWTVNRWKEKRKTKVHFS